MNTNTTKPTVSEIMAAQDRKDILLSAYAKAKTKEEQVAIQIEYDALQQRCDIFFNRLKIVGRLTDEA